MKILERLSLGILLLLLACQSKVQLHDLDWLIGTWQIEGKANFEEWKQVNDHLYRGKGYQIRKNDTLVTETIEIAEIGSEIFFIPIVADQNDGKAVMFKLISNDPENLIFENKIHDFPQRIIYQKNGDSRIDAGIEGQGKNGFSKVEFFFVKR